ncbi:MAG TPA: HD-GYP domain-containing protein [Chloroflexota bacterium]|nr:HD-GYP domain-containing protein [Chloroflexota bacterium]
MGPETVRGLEQALNVHLRQVERLQAQLRSLRSAVVNTIAALLEARDQATSAHSEAVTECAVLVARELGLTNADVDAVRMAALLHDVGKIAVADAVLLKPGPLDPHEWDEMRRHPVVAQQLLATLPLPPDTVAAVRHHHERYDGGGYPDGLAGEAIPLAARIVAVADAFHAMTSDRPYRRRLTIAEARAEIARCAESHFCPRVVAAFLRISGDPEFERAFAA